MKKLLPALLFSLSLCPLSSCSSEDKIPLIRSGDLLVSGASTYSTIGNGKSVERMMKAMDGGESALFIFAGFDCSYCLSFERAFVSYLRDHQSDVYVYYCENAESRASWFGIIDSLVSYYGYETRAESPFTATPRFFLGNKDGVEMISQGDVSESYVNNAVNARAFYANSYRFCSFSNFQNAEKEEGANVILYSESDASSYSEFYESVYPQLTSSGETAYILDYDSFSEEEKIASLGYFSLSEYAFTIINR